MKTIQVTGSSGKGSTVALLSSIFKAAGRAKLGTYIPRPGGGWPFAERCDVDGVSTALYSRTSAFDRLREAGAEIVVHEGTDTVDHRERLAVGVITSALDDTGRPAVENARRKSDVLAREGVPLVIGAMSPECAFIVERTARGRGARLIAADDEAVVNDFTDGCATVTIRTSAANYRARLRMRGRVQVANAVIAVRVAELVGVTPDAICNGLESGEPLGGRLMYVNRGSQTLLVDFVKNVRGAELLRDYIAERHPGGVAIAVRLKGYRDEVRDILQPVARHLTFDDSIPGGDFVVIAGPSISDLVPDTSGHSVTASSVNHG